MPNRFKAPSTVSSATTATTVLRLPGAYPLSAHPSLLSVASDTSSTHAADDEGNTPQRLIAHLRSQLEELSRRYQYDLDCANLRAVNTQDQLERELARANTRADSIQRRLETRTWEHQQELRALNSQLQAALDDLAVERRARISLAALVDQLKPKQPEDVFASYATQWQQIGASRIPHSTFTIESFPWPVLSFAGSSKSITAAALQDFLLHEARPDTLNKTRRAVIRAEIPRYHSDKFNPHVLPLFVPEHRQAAAALAGIIVRHLIILAGSAN